jgi:hypothetical protein
MKIKDRENNYYADYQNHERKSKVYVNDEEREELIRLNANAYILFEYYLQSYNNPRNRDNRFTDEKAAKILGWTTRKVAGIRKKLETAGWYYQVSGVYSDKRKITSTYLGKQKVYNARNPGKSYAGKNNLKKIPLEIFDESKKESLFPQVKQRAEC